MKVKLCGFSDENSVKSAILQGCDFLGFIFFDKSPRLISVKKAAEISAQIPSNISKVAVVVDANFEFLTEIATDFRPDFFQFHGAENTDFLQKCRQKFPQIKIIKAIKIGEKKDLEKAKEFENFCDFLLFDSKVIGEEGGSGKKFDWKIMQNFTSKNPWFLSGGLNIENIKEALEISGATMIDISSGIEEIRGKKSPKLIAELMNYLRSNNIYDLKN